MPVVMAVEVPTFSLSQISLFLYLSQSENKYLNWYVPFYRHPLASAERISSAAAVPQSAISAWSALPWLWSPLVRLSSGATTTKEVSFVFLSYGRIFCFLRFLEKLQKKKKRHISYVHSLSPDVRKIHFIFIFLFMITILFMRYKNTAPKMEFVWFKGLNG